MLVDSASPSAEGGTDGYDGLRVNPTSSARKSTRGSVVNSSHVSYPMAADLSPAGCCARRRILDERTGLWEDYDDAAGENEEVVNIDYLIEVMKAAEQGAGHGLVSLAGRGNGVPGLCSDCDIETGLRKQASEKPPSPPSVMRFDIFLSHLQRNGQDAIISMRMFLQKSQPGLRTFIDLEVDMRGGLTNMLKDSIEVCGCFLFFITDGILQSEWCAQELRWAVEFGKTIVLVRETDERHGGIEMKDFFKQVPEDLLHVFQNHIAIPWYRQPAFRDVSVRTILSAANVADAYDMDMHHLHRCQIMLKELTSVTRSAANAFDVIQEHSFAMRVVFWLAGFQHLRNPRANFIYVLIFNLSFWFCGLLCATNLVYQCVPFQIMSVDFLTAAVHLPGWQGWLRWREYVNSPACNDLLAQIKGRPERYQFMGWCVKAAGWVIMTLQLTMVGIVLCGFSLPLTLNLGQENMSMPSAPMFTLVHAWVMWFIIPPVIASIFASYSMFAFVALLHMLDVEKVEETVSECANILARFYAKVRDDSSEACSSDRSADLDRGSEAVTQQAVDEIEARQRQLHMEARLFDQVLEVLQLLADKTQSRMDATCEAVSCLWVNLVLFSTMQVLVISTTVASRYAGIFRMSFRWWWALQDVFHFIGGIILLFVSMGALCCVTTKFTSVPSLALRRLQEASCPPTRQVEVVAYLTARPRGLHVLWGTVYMDYSKAAGFFFVILVAVVNSLTSILNTLSVGMNS
mmetsp:Transcript_29513/g.75084  ORF Transcript_29513/g.75084 Transcript_29513/m.75084 type:complete len:744 (-) Transcript_29513:78-2309(-)